MKFDQDFIDRVREANNIVEVIGQYTDLKSRGHRFSGLCPFPDHNEKTPSFSVSEDKQLYHCFGCKKSGNIFTFLETYSGMTFPDAVKYLARRASIPLPEASVEDKAYNARKTEKEIMLKLNRLAGYYFLSQFKKLPESHPGKTYFKQRGLSDEVVERFKLGVILDDWSGLANYLRSQKAPLDKAEKLGLIRKRKSGDGYFDLFRERVIFPIFSPTGDCIGFGGRSFGDAQPKYLNSPESPVFHKGRMVYGLNESAKHIRSKDQVIVVEGYMDYLALVQAGIHNVVATLGTALTSDHGRLLKRYSKNIVLLFDGDSAGMNAAERSLEVLLHEDLLPKACFLPDGLDPDDFIKQNSVEELERRIHKAKDLFDHKMGTLLKNFQGQTSEKFRIIKELAPLVLATKDQGLRNFLTLEISQSLSVTVETLVGQLKAAHNETQKRGMSAASKADLTKSVKSQTIFKNSDKPSDSNKIDLSDSPRDELLIFSLALKAPELLEFIIAQNVVEIVTHHGVKAALSEALEKYGQKSEKFDKLAGFLASKLSTPGSVTFYMTLTPGELTDSEGLQMLKDCVARLKSRHLRSQARRLVSDTGGEPSRDDLERIMNIHRDRLSLKDKN